MKTYGVYVGEEDRGYIIAESLSEAEERAEALYPDNKEEITVSFTEISEGV
jgi:hypothetical protein